MRLMALGYIVLILLVVPQIGESQQAQWESLNRLRPGQNIQVVDQQLRSLEGDFLGLSEEQIRLLVEKNEVAVPRQDVFRVTLSRGSRGKHALIGLGIGAAAGAVSGAIGFKDDSFFGPQVAAVALGVIGAAVGGTAGALLPAGQSTLYQAERRQMAPAP